MFLPLLSLFSSLFYSLSLFQFLLIVTVITKRSLVCQLNKQIHRLVFPLFIFLISAGRGSQAAMWCVVSICTPLGGLQLDGGWVCIIYVWWGFLTMPDSCCRIPTEALLRCMWLCFRMMWVAWGVSPINGPPFSKPDLCVPSPDQMAWTHTLMSSVSNRKWESSSVLWVLSSRIHPQS